MSHFGRVIFLSISRSYRLRCLVTIAAVILLGCLPIHAQSRLSLEIENSGHALLFGLAAVLLLRNYREGPRPYLISFLFAVSAGVGLEFAQSLLGGDAEFQDIMRDAMGAGAFLGFAYTYSRTLTFRKKTLLRSAAIALILIAFDSPLLTSIALARRWFAFPVVVDFGSQSERRFRSLIKARCAILSSPWQKVNRLPV
jgi:hypothetical protein